MYIYMCTYIYDDTYLLRRRRREYQGKVTFLSEEQVSARGGQEGTICLRERGGETIR